MFFLLRMASSSKTAKAATLMEKKESGLKYFRTEESKLEEVCWLIH